MSREEAGLWGLSSLHWEMRWGEAGPQAWRRQSLSAGLIPPGRPRHLPQRHRGSRRGLVRQTLTAYRLTSCVPPKYLLSPRSSSDAAH